MKSHLLLLLLALWLDEVLGLDRDMVGLELEDRRSVHRHGGIVLGLSSRHVAAFGVEVRHEVCLSCVAHVLFQVFDVCKEWSLFARELPNIVGPCNLLLHHVIVVVDL